MTLTILGLIVGFTVGATGVGAGSLMAPALLIIARVPAAEVVTMTLAYSSVTKLVSSVGHVWNRNVDWRVVGWLACGSMVGTTAAIQLRRAWMGPSSSHGLDMLIGALLVAVGALSAGRTWLGRATPPTAAAATDPSDAASDRTTPMRRTALVAGGLFVGTITTLTSIGVGAITAPLLLSATRLSPARTVATNIVHAFILTAIASLVYASLGISHLGGVGLILLGSIPGVLLGGMFTRRVHSTFLTGIVSTAVVVAGVMVLVGI